MTSETVFPEANPSEATESITSNGAAKDEHAVPKDAGSLEASHLDEKVVPVLSLSVAERARHILSDVTLYHPNFLGLLNEAEWMVREPRRSRARGIFLAADPGMGKTLLSQELARMFPMQNRPRDSLNEGAWCAVSISMSGARRTKAVLNRILEATGAPIGKTVTIGDQEIAVVAHLRRLNCGLLILDETQDLLGAQETEQLRVMEVIKYLMNELSLPVLALGTNPESTPFKLDPHLAARFEIMPLPAWEVGDDLATFLSDYERTLPLKRASGLSKKSIQELLVKRTGGITDGILRCLRNAALWAMVDGTERITVELLGRARYRPDIEFIKEELDHAA